ncbi:uncharacterized protein JCM10292_003506 [Rhodotorula paludigena]|uniref:uncharacterized protein n=1 Tax=Rhodotorula paludigena TaxID=86838 RepID=UPI00316D764A
MGAPFALPAKSSLGVLPALSFFLASEHDRPPAPRRTSTAPSTAAFFAREPVSRAVAPRGSAGPLDEHQGGYGQRYGRSEMELRLSTTCPSCRSPVAVEVPAWMLSAMEGAQHIAGAMQHEQAYERQYGQQDTHPAAAWRERIIEGAVHVARSVKASPIPGMILAFLQALFACVLYLDRRFDLHQRLAVMLGVFLEGLVEIEREVGVMRNVGEALSIGWEATVKGIIAFAKADAPSAPNANETTSRSQSAVPMPQRWPGSPALPQQEANYVGMQFTPRPHIASPEHPDFAGHEYMGADSVSTTRAPSPVLSHPRPLHRSYLSSPSLQSSYLAGTNALNSPAHERTTLSLSSSPSDSLLPPYDIASHSAHTTGYAPFPHSQLHGGGPAPTSPVRPRIVRQRSATNPHEPLLRADGTAYESAPAPPPSPTTAARGGWAGKAVLGLAERMNLKVI